MIDEEVKAVCDELGKLRVSSFQDRSHRDSVLWEVAKYAKQASEQLKIAEKEQAEALAPLQRQIAEIQARFAPDICNAVAVIDASKEAYLRVWRGALEIRQEAVDALAAARARHDVTEEEYAAAAHRMGHADPPPRISGFQVTESEELVVLSSDKLPRDWLIPDPKKLKEHVKTAPREADPPGTARKAKQSIAFYALRVVPVNSEIPK